MGHPGDDLRRDADVQTWVAENAASLSPNLQAAAVTAVRNVRASSELRDLWEEADLEAWDSRMADLANRLQP